MWGPMSLDEQMTTWTWSVLKTSKRIVVKLLPFTVFTATTKELVDRIPSPPVTASLTPRSSTKWISLSPRNTTQTSGGKKSHLHVYMLFSLFVLRQTCVLNLFADLESASGLLSIKLLTTLITTDGETEGLSRCFSSVSTNTDTLKFPNETLK